MCRLLGWVTPTSETFDAAVGTEQIARFRDMACLHNDGWGAAWLDDDLQLERHRWPDRADTSPEFARIVETTTAPAAIMHLRLATGGMPNAMVNTHPFLADGMAFAHNGFAGPADELEELLSPEIRATLEGVTDSERYFGAIRTRLAEGLDLSDAVVRTVSDLRELYPLHSLNAMLLTADRLVIVHASERSLPDLEAMLEGGFTIDTLPAEHAEGYYAMRMRRDADGTLVFASSGLDPEGWEPLPAESVTIVDIATGALTTRSLLPDFVE